LQHSPGVTQNIDDWGPVANDIAVGENHVYPEDPSPDEAVSGGSGFRRSPSP